MADKRTYIRVDDGIEDHPKVLPLSDKAFRLLITTWGWCSRKGTDGQVVDAVWGQRGTSKARAELVKAGLAERCDGYVQMHDYLEHQRSADQIAEAVEKKKTGARLGNHRRWHIGGVIDPVCEYCPPVEPTDPDPPEPSHEGSHIRSEDRSDHRSQNHRFGSPEDRGQRTEKEPTPVGMAPHDSNVRDEPRPPAATGPTAVEAFRLVRRTLGLDYPAATCTALAYHAADLLKQYDEDTVQAGLEDWRGRTGIGPGVLPSLVADLIKRRNGHARPDRRRNADDTIADLLAPTGTDAVILQLTRGEP